MTKQRAIKILKKLIEYKKRSVLVLGDDKFGDKQIESLRDTLKRLAQSDRKNLERILEELQPKKDDTERKKKSL